jgi:hypothetical protein
LFHTLGGVTDIRMAKVAADFLLPALGTPDEPAHVADQLGRRARPLSPGLQPLERLAPLPDPSRALTAPSSPSLSSPIFVPGIGSSHGSGRDVAP